ncbi:MAG: FecR domain-containing protein [Caulobacteraceae bacterium]|nr:FecR domain-containing protein [Caulobacteraceae bacterium]
MGQDARSRRDEVRQAAALWVVRLSDPSMADAERAAFEVWRGADPRHEVAYEREAAAWERLGRLRALRPADDRPEPDLLAPRRTAPVRVWRSPRRWAAAASIAFVAAAATAMTLDLTAATAYATGVGERRVVVLADGSRIELNTDSRVLVRYRRGKREVRVVRGEVLFDVARDARPFVVLASQTRLQAGASQLDVRLRDDGAAQVVVKDGSVAVAAPDLAPTSRALRSGAEAYYGPGGGSVHDVSGAEIDRSLAWRQGAVAFNGQSLAEAVAEFNRYNTHHLVITDDSISTLRVAGYFQSSDLPGFVHALSGAFPIKAETAVDGSIYLSRAN